MNTIMTRGKRVVAEVVVQREALQRLMGVDTAEVFRMRQISQAGAFLTGSANSGAHSANGLTAMFIATGQDVANVVESHAAIVYAQLLENGDYYWSITIPSLIVATYGGRHRTCHAEGMPGDAGLLRGRKGKQVCRDMRGSGARG